MSCTFDYLNNGYVIHFQTRGLTDDEADELWRNLNPSRCKRDIEETGQCLLALDGYALFIRKGKGNNIIVECGREVEDELQS